MVIKIANHVERCYSNEEGKIIKNIIENSLRSNEPIVISFEGVHGVTSSFVNTAFIELLDEFNFDKIKSNIKFTNTTRQINSMIKERYSFEVKKRNDLVKS
ncbi:STAS-like domain-containing protein [Oceanobacillus oncorhynchi]|uniref:STAS-like domain-containing protein n=1 Tax=Oceanobacillus oncorhynchi TaxID=545501 RepID=UPI001866BE15|nr:STAS-like domain-containing protein [Oceanobacillus oncorhynchi]